MVHIARDSNHKAVTAPSIITSTPQENLEAGRTKRSAFTLTRRHKPSELTKAIFPKPSSEYSARESRTTYEEADRFKGLAAPPAYGDDSNSSLALPVLRLSESSRSEGSLGDHRVYATTTTTHTVSTTTTIFRLPRRKKNKAPLFPLPVKIFPPESSHDTSFARGESPGDFASASPRRVSPAPTPPLIDAHHSSYSNHEDSSITSPLPSSFHTRDDISGTDPNNSGLPESSSSVRTDPAPLGRRGRSSTKGSVKKSAEDDPLPTPPLAPSGRTSSSTTGRSSLGGIFSLPRLRQNSEPVQLRQSFANPAIPATPVLGGSKSQSISLHREPLMIPGRQDGDTPAKYLIRLEEAVSRGFVASILSQSNDEFFKNVLRSYTRGFKFFGDPLDMSIRKLLMEVELPKETQQIDRVLQAFANRYHECNPGVYASPGMYPSSFQSFIY